jgi:glycogen(starch) synthase
MRILHFTERFWPYIGGIEVAGATLLPELVRRGHEVVVVTDDGGGRLPARDDFRGVAVHRFPIVLSSRTARIDQVRRSGKAVAALRRRVRPDVIHAAFLGVTTGYATATAAAHPGPFLLSFHGSWPELAPTAAGPLTRVIGRADWITACSASTLAELVRDWDVAPDRASVIANGFDSPAEIPAQAVMDPPTLLCVARLAPEKGIDVAIAALAGLLEHLPGASLQVAGDGPERAALERQAAELGVEHAVRFLGWVGPPDVQRLLAGASIALVPSRQEGFGLFALEASLAARPILASSVGGLAEILRHGETAWLVPPDDPAALAAAVVELAAEPSRAWELADAARRVALSQWTTKRNADAYEDLLGRLADAYRPEAT